MNDDVYSVALVSPAFGSRIDHFLLQNDSRKKKTKKSVTLYFYLFYRMTKYGRSSTKWNIILSVCVDWDIMHTWPVGRTQKVSSEVAFQLVIELV